MAIEKYYIRLLQDGPDLQSGAYMILVGWIVAFLFQIVSQVQKEK